MKRVHLVPIGVAVVASVLGGGCRKGDSLGAPDSYVVYAQTLDDQGVVKRSASGLPVFDAMALDAPLAAPLHQQIAVGFLGEMIRTDYLGKEIARDVNIGGHGFPEAARAAAREPTIFVIGRGMPAAGVGLATKGTFGGAADHAGVPWLGLRDTFGGDRAMPQTIGGALARRIAARLTGEDETAGSLLVEGYARAMEVIAREWRVGEGADGAVAPGAGTGLQRSLFTGVRDSLFAVDEAGAPRPAAALLSDPGLAATIIYRMAQSKLVGHKVAPAEVYAPFVTEHVPPGVSPAAVLGPFRNFQAKLLMAWARAILGGTPPRDIVDLVDDYARALPDERAEAWRIFVVTTWGATVKPGGVDARKTGVDAALPELTALAAEVASGRRSPRAALGR
ncbi:MAG TPA: hypothetical protein VHJ20_23865 [Polyangia bacterium]|nr:hypothetical protein [Polyangia bacterium]